jgi:hypothetical protein
MVPDSIPRRMTIASVGTNRLNRVFALDGLERVRKCFRFTESRDSRVELNRYQAENDVLCGLAR